jgi:hypothetical protein
LGGAQHHEFLTKFTAKEISMRTGRKRYLVAVLVVGVLSIGFWTMAQESPKQSDDWLLGAGDDSERFKLIQQMFGGFSAAMQIVGERYERTYDAIADTNYDLAKYHWKKIKEAIELGYLRRPGRKANAESLFLKDPWISGWEGLDSKEQTKAKEGFLTARSACMACHIAEKVPFMNDQPMFRRTGK